MKELLDLGLKQYHPGQAEITRRFDCPHCGELADQYDRKRLVGWMEFNPKPYGVFECISCSGLFSHHINYFGKDIVEAAEQWIFIWQHINKEKSY